MSRVARVTGPGLIAALGKAGFRVLRVTGIALNVLIIGGLVVYVSRVSSPSDTVRFMRPVQFRG